MRVIWESTLSRRDDIKTTAKFLQPDRRANSALFELDLPPLPPGFVVATARLMTGFASLIPVSRYRRGPIRLL
jgi:hypothetical protein